MTKEEYLRSRISELEKIVYDRSIPLKIRKNQAIALITYTLDLQKEIGKSK